MSQPEFTIGIYIASIKAQNVDWATIAVKTGENAIGKWVDGKTIYAYYKTLTVREGTYSTVRSASDIDTFLGGFGMRKYGTAGQSTLPYADEGTQWVFYLRDGYNEVVIRNDGSGNATVSAWCIIFYTKK